MLPAGTLNLGVLGFGSGPGMVGILASSAACTRCPLAKVVRPSPATAVRSSRLCIFISVWPTPTPHGHPTSVETAAAAPLFALGAEVIAQTRPIPGRRVARPERAKP